MLTYNTQQPALAMPEYGRLLHQMVEQCVAIADRDERNRCARTIVATMRTLHPQTGSQEEIERKLWDHLAIMSGFALDVDYPYEVIKPDDINTPPEPVSLRATPVMRRVYGKNVERMIDAALHAEPGEERDHMVMLLANHMKKLKLDYNPDGVSDESVFADLEEMSHGELRLNPEMHRLNIYTVAEVSTAKKKRRKRR